MIFWACRLWFFLEDTCVIIWKCAFLYSISCVMSLLFLGVVCQAEVSVNVPLDDPAYPLLEKVVSSGLTFTNALTTRPITRLHAARIVAEAIEQRRREMEIAQWNEAFLDDVLEYLAKRFKSELQQLGFLIQIRRSSPVLVSLLNELKLEVVGAYDPFVIRDRSGLTKNLQGVFAGREGFAYGENFSLRTRSLSWATFWNHGAIYLEPEALIRSHPLVGERFEVDLHRAYTKLSAWNLEIALGRDSVHWGPGLQNDLVLSNNAPPLDLLKASTPEPFRLPGPFRELGEWQITYFVARLEEERTIPHALLSSLRLTLQPSSYVKFGFTNTFQAFGRGGVSLEPLAYGYHLIVPEFTQEGRTINSLVAYDLVVTLPFIRETRFLKSVKMYWQRGNDNAEAIGGLWKGGNLLGGIIDGGRWDMRFEFAETRDMAGALWYTHPTYQSGFAFKQFFLGHPIGGDAQSLFGRATYYFSPTTWIAFDGTHEEYGVDAQRTATSQQRLGLEATYQLPWLQREVILWGRIEYALLEEPGEANQRAVNLQLFSRWRF